MSAYRGPQAARGVDTPLSEQACIHAVMVRRIKLNETYHVSRSFRNFDQLYNAMLRQLSSRTVCIIQIDTLTVDESKVSGVRRQHTSFLMY